MNSSLIFVPDRYSFENGKGIPFTKEMLTWPIYRLVQPPQGSILLDDHLVQMHRKAIQALLALPGIVAKVVMTVDLKGKRLRLTPWTWASLWHDGREVLSFTYDTRTLDYNIPFALNDVYEWPELHEHYCSAAQWTEVRRLVGGWDINDWRDFFLKRLQEKGYEIAVSVDEGAEWSI